MTSAITCIYFCFIVWFLNSVTNLLFCLSSSSRYSPFYRFKNALAYCAAWPCIKNILLCSVYFIYFASFYFSFYLCLSFYYYFFLYSAIDFALTSSNLFFSASTSSFFCLRSAYFCFASYYLAAKIVFFFWEIVDLNYYFFLLFVYLLCSSYLFCSSFTSYSLFLSWSRFISSSKPILTYYIYCFGLAFIFFSSSRI